MHATSRGGRWRISDDLWAFVEPLLPKHPNTHRFGGGRPRRSDRDAMDAIFFVLRTGCQWNALNATGICPSSTAHRRFQEWCGAGVFLELWRDGLKVYDELKGLDWSWLSLDGAMTKAPLGGEKNRPESHGPGQAGHETQPAGRGPGRRGRLGRGGSQPGRLQVGA
jgi:putative transposase